MGSRQREFLDTFKKAFEASFLGDIIWVGGQGTANTAGLAPDSVLRRDGQLRPGERFELGDLRCDVARVTVIVEYDTGPVAVQNLLKYWPYIRGELASLPACPITLCHFSDWSSYGSYRDLWQWLLKRMREDPARRVDLQARQFDHGGSDVERSRHSLVEAVHWLAEAMR